MNKAILLGFVGRDPRMRMSSGTAIAEFPLATSERQAGGVEITEWHNIVMHGPAAEFAERYIRKGSRLLVEGRIRTRYWEDSAAIRRNITEIYTDTFELLPGRNN